MEIILKGKPKEIAALVEAVQERQTINFSKAQRLTRTEFLHWKPGAQSQSEEPKETLVDDGMHIPSHSCTLTPNMNMWPEEWK